MNKKPTAERLQEAFAYDARTGELRWRASIGSRAVQGAAAGTLATRGELVVRLDGVLRRVHHIIWCMHHGRWPEALVSHANKVKTDNRIENLMVVTKAQAHEHTRAERITKENINSIFRYESGHIYWRQSLTGKNRVEGVEAGHINEDGYRVVETAGKAIGAHRIIWLMHHGAWPTGEIDHINGNRADNRIENLRDVVKRTNSENRRRATSGSKTGVLGVEELPSGRFRARIRSFGKIHDVGIFDSTESAHAAYVQAKRKMHTGNTL